MTPFKYSYPDVPFITDRATYDYYRNIDTLLRKLGASLAELQNEVIKLQAAQV